MLKKSVKSDHYVWVTYRCDKCRNQFAGIVKRESGVVRLTCSVCGKAIVVYP